MDNSTYFASLPFDRIVGALKQVDDDWYGACERRSLVKLWRLIFCQSQGIKPNSSGSSEHGLQFVGEDQEFVRFRLNMARSHIKQRNQMAQGERVAWKAIASNGDSTSLESAKVGQKLLNYLTRACRVDYHGAAALEGDGFFGKAFLWVRWDYDAGDDVEAELPAVDEETGEPLAFGEDQFGPAAPVLTKQTTKSGFPVVSKLYPWQVAEEQYCTEPNWYIVKESVSKHELAARFPEHAEKIKAVDNLNKARSTTPMLGWDTSTNTKDTVILCHFYHRATKAIPNGRYVGYLDDIGLWDEPCPTEMHMPVVPICTAKYFGTEMGYPEAADLLAVQEMIDETLSQTASNAMRFGNQNLWAQEGTEVDEASLAKGGSVNFFKDKPPMAIQWASMPETAKFLLEYLPQRMNELTGLNSVARGQPDKNIQSGSFGALMLSIAEKYQGATQAAYDQAINQLGNILLEFVRNKAAHGFVMEVAGSDHLPYVQNVQAEELKGIRRVWVERANPIMNSWLGRMEMLNATKDLPRDTKKGAIEMLLTGDLDAYTRQDETQSILIAKENERLMKGLPVQAMGTDNVKYHCPEHQAALDRLRCMDSPDPIAVKAFVDHLAEHGMLYSQADPIMASILGNPPPPQIPPAGPPQLPPADAGKRGALPPGAPEPKQLPPPPQPESSPMPAAMPSMPQPPGGPN